MIRWLLEHLACEGHGATGLIYVILATAPCHFTKEETKA